MQENIAIENNFDELDKFINDPKNIIELANELAEYDYKENFEGKSEKEIDDMYFYFLKKGIYGKKRRRDSVWIIEGKNSHFMDINEFEAELNDYGQDCVSESGKKIDDVHFSFLEEKSKATQKKQEPDCYSDEYNLTVETNNYDYKQDYFSEPGGERINNLCLSFLEEKSKAIQKKQESDCYSDGHDWIFNKAIDESAIPRIDVLRGYCEKGHKFECMVGKTIDEKNSIITMLKHMIILDILALRYMSFDIGKNNNLTIKEKIADYCKNDLMVERRKAFLVDKTKFVPGAKSMYSSWSGMLVFNRQNNYLSKIVYGTQQVNCVPSCPYTSDPILSNIFVRYVKCLMYNSMNRIESVENNGWTLEESIMPFVDRAFQRGSFDDFVDIFVDYLNSTNELEEYFFYSDKACNFKSCFCKSLDKFRTVCSYIIKNNPNAFDEFYLKVGAKKFIEQMILFLDCETIVEIKNGKRTYDQEYKNMLSNQSEMIGKRLAVILRCLNIIGFENAFREYLNQNQIEDKIKNEIFKACKKYKSQSNDMQKNNMDANDYRSEFENEYFLPDKLLEYDVSENEVALQIKTENNFQQTPVQQSSYINFFVYIFSGLTIIFSLLIFVYTYFFIAALTFLILSVICLIIKFCYGKNENDIDIKPQKTKTNTIPLNKYIEKNENDLNLEDTNKITLTRDYQEKN